MTNVDLRPGLPLSAVQLAWLQELGMDRRLLQQFVRRPEPAAPAALVPTEKILAQALQGVQSAAQIPAQPVAENVRHMSNTGEAGSAPEAAPSKRPPIPLPKVGERAAPPVLVRPAVALPAEWPALKEHVAACQACSLYTGRSQTVFGSGATESVEWMVIGEAPGDRDDRMGLPFQGKAGELLHAMLEAAGLGAEVPVFYTNIIKCRPRGNRTPKPEEIAACRPYLLRQIEVLKPQRILALGWLAAQSLLADSSDLELLRGRVHWLETEGAGRIPVIATYHPASLLSRAQHKANAWRDLNLARSV